MFQNGADPYLKNRNPFYYFLKKIVDEDSPSYSYELLEQVMDLIFEQGLDMDKTKGDKTAFKFICTSLRTTISFLDDLLEECEEAEIRVRKAMKIAKYLLTKNPDCWSIKLTDIRQNALDEWVCFEISAGEVMQEVLSSVRSNEKYRDIAEDVKEIIRRHAFESNRESASAVSRLKKQVLRELTLLWGQAGHSGLGSGLGSGRTFGHFVVESCRQCDLLR